MLDRYRQLFDAAQRVLPAQRLREHHAPALGDFDALIARGQAEGAFRTDLPTGWLITVIYSLFHAAAEDVNVGRLRRADAPDVLEATLLPLLAAPGAGHDRGNHPAARPSPRSAPEAMGTDQGGPRRWVPNPEPPTSGDEERSP